jgi:hypothetical protein
MRIDSDGHVGIGTTDPQVGLQVEASDGSVNGTIRLTATGVASAGMAMDANGLNFGADTGGFLFKTSATANDPSDTGTERMKIGSNGHLYATNSDTSLANLTLKKSAGDTIDYLQCRKTDNDLRIVLEGSGDVHNATGTFSAISDEKLKENIVDASSQWDDIKNIKIRNFSLKADKLSEANMIGVVAQEIEKVSPNLVKERIDTNPYTGEDLGTKTKIVKYSILHTKAVKALQEAMERIETLEAEVKTLKGE